MTIPSVLALGLLAFAAASARADVPREIEPDYARAVLAYNAREYGRTVKLLDELLKGSPEVAELLELKALTLKADKQMEESARTYERLIELRTKEGKRAREIAPYHFELGVIRYKQGRAEDARPHLAFSAEEGFNEGASFLYLGMIAYQQGEWGVAEDHFLGVLGSGEEDLEPAARFYLAQANAKTGYGSRAVHHLLQARKTARAVSSNEKTSEEARRIAARILESSEKALAPFDRSDSTMSLGFLSGYDSNPNTLPSEPGAAPSGISTSVQTLLGSIGYATSPLRSIQLAPSYGLSANLHLNSDAKATEYFDNLLALGVNVNPLARLSYGAKVDLLVSFRNDANAQQRFQYRVFSAAAGVYPYLRYELAKRWTLTFELTAQPQRYFQDGRLDPSLRRTGITSGARLTARNERGSRYWNPVASLRFSSHDPKTTGYREFDYEGLGLELSSPMRFTERLTATPTVELTRYRYRHRSSSDRVDAYFSVRATGSYRLDPKWTLVANVDRASNRSGPSSSGLDAIYSYTRFSFSAGASYAF